ncbi:hypothetical protein K439DRAFT_1386994 [Ramaria rubella]|nr:hypothetical protein K439DRAFT_1386994 [Ramaria rubella]
MSSHARTNDGTKQAKSQYHHVIPRFILREFQIGPKLSKAQRRKQSKKGSVNEEVRFYSIADGTLSARPIGTVYGVQDLYRDVRNMQDANELEKKLSVLEYAAARVIQDIHRTIDDADPGTFTCSREDLEKLRKFLFIMHYRNDALSLSYFQADHPENAPIRERIQKFGDKLGLRSPGEIWLYFLRYYLDTPHSQIGLDAMTGPNGPDPMAILDPNMDSEQFEAVTYQQHAGMYYLGILQAAPGEEFVLSHNSFGLWEGRVDGFQGLHRLFIISPRIAVLLRLNWLRPEMVSESPKFRAACRSDLVDIKFRPAASSTAITLRSNIDLHTLQTYKMSNAAKKDKFNFNITKLTEKETYAVNSVVLLNTRREGSITFRSPKCMLHTAQKFAKDPDIGCKQERFKYEALIQQLTKDAASTSVHIANSKTPPSLKVTSPSSNTSSAKSSQRSHITPEPIQSMSRAPETKPDITSEIDGVIAEQLGRLVSPTPTDSADYYQRIHTLWTLCSVECEGTKNHPFVCAYRRILAEVVHRFSSGLSEHTISSSKPCLHAKIMSTLSSKQAVFLFITLDKLLSTLGFASDSAELESSIGSTSRSFHTLLEDAVGLGFVSWLAKNYPNILDTLLGKMRIVE